MYCIFGFEESTGEELLIDVFQRSDLTQSEHGQ